MRPLSSQDQEYVITLDGVPTNPFEITITYIAVFPDSKNSVGGAHIIKSTSTQEQLLSSPNENTEVSKEIDNITIYSPVGNSAIVIDIDFKDNFPSTPVLHRVQSVSLSANAFVRYSKELGWT